MSADKGAPRPPVGEELREAVERLEAHIAPRRRLSEVMESAPHLQDDIRTVLSALPRGEGEAVAWRFRHGTEPWQVEDHKPGNSDGWFEVQPLYASPITGGGEGLGSSAGADTHRATGGAVAGLDDRLLWFLRVIEGAGGKVDAGDNPGNALAVFCDDRGDDNDDTYNLSEDRGLTRTAHSGWGDGAATVEITDEGRAVLAKAEAALQPQEVSMAAMRDGCEASGAAIPAVPTGDVEALLSDLTKGRDKREVGDPVRAEFERHIATVSALLAQPGGAGECDLLERFGQDICLELSFAYDPDDEGAPGAWSVHRVNGGRNDREWTLIGTGDTPRKAIAAALPAAPDTTGEG